MEFRQPATWAEALSLRAEQPQAVVIQGGTDVMVELNYDRHRPATLIDLSRVPELTRWSRDGDTIRLGAGVPYSRIIAELAGLLPGLAMASRTVGSLQIRNRGSVGGNLGAASPAGDTHPVLLATGAHVVAESLRGARTLPVEEFYVGVKRNALAPDELIREVLLPVARGPQQYSKIGTRNAMVIAVAAFGLALHPDARTVGTGIGSAAPTPRRAAAAEDFVGQALAAQGFWDSRTALPDSLTTRFGDLVASAASPIDDVRGTARYRAHALSVMGRRSLTWAWTQYQNSAKG